MWRSTFAQPVSANVAPPRGARVVDEQVELPPCSRSTTSRTPRGRLRLGQVDRDHGRAAELVGERARAAPRGGRRARASRPARARAAARSPPRSRLDAPVMSATNGSVIGAQAYPVRFRWFTVSSSTIALITVPVVTGVIGYVDELDRRADAVLPGPLPRLARARGCARSRGSLPHKIRQIPGIMVGGIGWQGIVPSRAAKMGSLAVDSGIAKLGTPQRVLQAARPGEDRRADRRLDARRDPRARRADHAPRASAAVGAICPPQFKELVHERVQQQLPDDRRAS